MAKAATMTKTVQTAKPAAGKVAAPPAKTHVSNSTKPAQKPQTALVVPKSNGGAVASASDFDQYASAGFEGVGANDVIIPRLTILQALSPQLQKNKPEYIKGAEAGNFCDVGTGEIFGEEIELVPCFFAKVYLEWAPRSTGRGLVRNHGTDASILQRCSPDEKGRMITEDGNYIAETATYYCLNITAGGRRSFVPLSSTQLKAARRWMTLLTAEKLTRRDGSQFTPPIFFRSWKAVPTTETNNEGDWFGWRFEAGRPILEIDPSKGLLDEAKAFYEQCRDGAVSGDLRQYDDGLVVNGEAKETDDM